MFSGYPNRGVVLVIALAAASCARPASEDPFASRGPEQVRSLSVLVTFGGRCGVCGVTLDVAGQRDFFVDTALIRRRHRVSRVPGATLSMSAVPIGNSGPVERIEIRVDGEVLAEARADSDGGLPGTGGTGALSVHAVLPQR